MSEINESAVEIGTPDGTADGYLYRPGGKEALAGVLQMTDIGGIRAANREMAKRVAALGYVVLLPNVFYRTAKPPVMEYPIKIGEERTMKRMAELRAPLTPDAMERDAAAYVDFLGRQEGVKAGPMAAVGYCFTGALAMRTAAARPDRITAAASFHGSRLMTDDPGSPHTVLPRISKAGTRLYFGHAVQDQTMPKEAIEKFEQALAAWSGRYESETYEGALHSWTVPDSPVYNKPQAERAFEKLRQLLREMLKS